MKAIMYEGPEQLKRMEIPEPEPKAGEVKLKIRACGICGSDVHGYLGSTGRRIPPMVMGHEFCGEVVSKGQGHSSFMLVQGYLFIQWIFAVPVKCAKEGMCIYV